MPNWTTRIVFVIQLHEQRMPSPPWNRTVIGYSPSGRSLTVTELGGVEAVKGVSASTTPTELVPTKNSTGPAYPLVTARTSAETTNVAGAAKSSPLRGEIISTTGDGGRPV